jgi:Protein of unknown function (DUF2510)/Domain of unknown function (DUF4328)
MDPTLWQQPDGPTGAAPAGWYPDAHQPGYLRWFDGRSWTADVHPGVPVPYLPAIPAPSPPDDLASERSARPWAKLGVCILAFYGPFVALLYALTFRSFWHGITNAFDTARLHQGQNVATPVFPSGVWVLDLASLVPLGGMVATMVWMYRAALMGKRLGMPMTLDPVWAVVGWLVPVVQIWFPYKVIAGTVPPGDPARRSAGRWWALYIVGGFLFGIVGVVLAFQSRALLVVLVPFLLYSWFEARQGLAMIEGVDAAHARAVKARGYGIPPR